MERESNQMQAMCRSGCGFFGNPSTEGLCSKCFKESLKKKQASTPATGERIPVVRPSNFLQEVGLHTDDACQMTREGITTGLATLASRGAGLLDLASASEIVEKSASAAMLEPASAAMPEPSADTPKKKRCLVCRRKLGLTGLECRCGGLYCATHRYSDKHDCTFDYRQLGADEIRRNNPVVVGDKIQKF